MTANSPARPSALAPLKCALGIFLPLAGVQRAERRVEGLADDARKRSLDFV